MMLWGPSKQQLHPERPVAEDLRQFVCFAQRHMCWSSPIRHLNAVALMFLKNSSLLNVAALHLGAIASGAPGSCCRNQMSEPRSGKDSLVVPALFAR